MGSVVRFRSVDDIVSEAHLRDVRTEALASALPWRTFRWHRGQQHFSGYWWSSTMGAHVVYESRLELARLVLADFDPTVEVIVAQPFLLESQVEGKVRRYVPDFLLLGVGRVVVVNVKPADRLAKPEVRATLGWAHRLLEERGWSTEVWSGTDPVVLGNVRFLAGFRRAVLFDPDLLAAAEDAAPGRTVAATEMAVADRWPKALVRPGSCTCCGVAGCGRTCRLFWMPARSWGRRRELIAGGDPGLGDLVGA
jgi:hypothetical protein